MPYDPELADRIRRSIEAVPGLVEKKMFGGIGWTLNGHMACGAHKDGRLMIRCGKEDFAAYLTEPHTGGIDHGKGKLLTGWLLVDAEAVESDDALDRWLERGLDHARSLPPKKPKAKKKKKE